MYKCPFCKSTDCEELRDYRMSQTTPTGSFMGSTYSYNDDLVEIRCNQCGIVTKIDPRIYKPEEE